LSGLRAQKWIHFCSTRSSALKATLVVALASLGFALLIAGLKASPGF
jgi:hypothetical protein